MQPNGRHCPACVAGLIRPAYGRISTEIRIPVDQRARRGIAPPRKIDRQRIVLPAILSGLSFHHSRARRLPCRQRLQLARPDQPLFARFRRFPELFGGLLRFPRLQPRDRLRIGFADLEPYPAATARNRLIGIRKSFGGSALVNFRRMGRPSPKNRGAHDRAQPKRPGSAEHARRPRTAANTPDRHTRTLPTFRGNPGPLDRSGARSVLSVPAPCFIERARALSMRA